MRAYGAAWGQRTTITYVPADTTVERRRIAVELLKAHLNYTPSIAQATVGPLNQMFVADYDGERERIYATYRGAPQVVLG
jgi:hypothetical protein